MEGHTAAPTLLTTELCELSAPQPHQAPSKVRLPIKKPWMSFLNLLTPLFSPFPAGNNILLAVRALPQPRSSSYDIPFPLLIKILKLTLLKTFKKTFFHVWTQPESRLICCGMQTTKRQTLKSSSNVGFVQQAGPWEGIPPTHSQCSWNTLILVFH